MNTALLKFGIRSLLLIQFIFFAVSCSEEDDGPANETNPVTNNSIDISGTYFGSIDYSETFGGVNEQGTLYDVTIILEGSGSTYTLSIQGPETGLGSISVGASENNFSGTIGNGFFEFDNVSGSLNGQNLSFNYNGSDGNDSWSGDFTGSKIVIDGSEDHLEINNVRDNSVTSLFSSGAGNTWHFNSTIRTSSTDYWTIECSFLGVPESGIYDIEDVHNHELTEFNCNINLSNQTRAWKSDFGGEVRLIIFDDGEPFSFNNNVIAIFDNVSFGDSSPLHVASGKVTGHYKY